MIYLTLCLFLYTQNVIQNAEFDAKDQFRKYDIISTEIQGEIDQSNRKFEFINDKCQYLEIRILRTAHMLCLINNNQKLGTSDIKIMLHTENTCNVTALERDDQLVTGFDLATPHASAVTGYIFDNHFFGRIRIEGRTYFVERLSKYPRIMEESNVYIKNLAILYDQDDYVGPMSQNYDAKYSTRCSFALGNTTRVHRVTRTIHPKPIGQICSVLLIGDNTFLHKIAHGNVRLATIEMISFLNDAETIFRRSDFNHDGISDNIGFKVKYITILGIKGRKDPDIRSRKQIYPNRFLLSLSNLTILEDVCLGIVFTAKSFSNHVIGVSFTAVDRTSQSELIHAGGICEQPTIDGNHLNLLAISTIMNAERTLTHGLIQLALAHEIGHSFGSFHDPVTTECSNFLMSPTSGDGRFADNYKFSNCSIRNIFPLLKKKSENCLEPVDEPYCGNEILEEGEDCDCGLFIDCIQKDPCCYPRDSAQPCKVNVRKQCHPSQGLCCTTDCAYRNLTHMGINCTHSTPPKTCPCPDPKARCDCGYFGQCVGQECHSIECTRIGLSECPCRRKSDTCGVCCSMFGTCIPAPKATILLYKNVTYLQWLLKQEWYLESNNLFGDGSRVRTTDYCNGSGTCARFEHHFWSSNEFCVFNGVLGICSARGRCLTLSPYKHVFPSWDYSRALMSYRNDVNRMGSCNNIVFKFLFYLLYLFIST